jgi:hypothetical protein
MRAAEEALPVEPIALAPEGRGGAEGLAVDDVGDVADHRCIEDRVDRLAIVVTSLVTAAEAVAAGDGVGVAHGTSEGVSDTLLSQHLV